MYLLFIISAFPELRKLYEDQNLLSILTYQSVEQYHEKFAMKDSYLVFPYRNFVSVVITGSIVTG